MNINKDVVDYINKSDDDINLLVDLIKSRLNDKLISELKIIIKNYGKKKRIEKNVGKLNKMNNMVFEPNFYVSFD